MSATIPTADQYKIIEAMCREAHYQDTKWSERDRTIALQLLIMRAELDEACEAVVRGRDEDALCEILQVMTAGMRALERHGIVERQAPLRLVDGP
jgi:hypothetical protein